MKVIALLLLINSFAFAAGTQYDCKGSDYNVRIYNFEPVKPVSTTKFMVVTNNANGDKYNCLTPDTPYHEDALFYQCAHDTTRSLQGGKRWSYMYVDVISGELQLNYDITADINCTEL